MKQYQNHHHPPPQSTANRDRGYTDVAEVTVGDEQRLGRWGNLAPLSSMAGGMGGTSKGGEGSSLVTLDLPKTPLAELSNVVDLYQSIFGITPDVRERTKIGRPATTD
jgi:hypothetical protein